MDNDSVSGAKTTPSKDNLFSSNGLVFSVIDIMSRGDSLAVSAQQMCDAIAVAPQLGGVVSASLSFDGQTFRSRDFVEGPISVKHRFDLPGNKNGIVELFLPRRPLPGFSEKWIEGAEQALKTVVPLLVGMISKALLEKMSSDITERRKELENINRTAGILRKNASLDELFQEICSFIPEAMKFPDQATARIQYGGKTFVSRGFVETPWMLSKNFSAPDSSKGSIVVCYLTEFPDADEGPFLAEERHLINNLASLIAGTVSKKNLKELLADNTRRLKELRGINRTTELLGDGSPLEEALPKICAILPESWQYPKKTVVRIKYGRNVYESPNFRVSKWKMEQAFGSTGTKKGTIEVFCLKEFPEQHESPFLKEERDLLANIANLISGAAACSVSHQLRRENCEKLKALRAIGQTIQIIDEGKTIDETLKEICAILPKSWKYPKHAVARIIFESKSYVSPRFKETDWVQTEHFVTIDNKKGTINIYYLKRLPHEDEGPFMNEERDLLVSIARLVGGFLNNVKGREIIHRKGVPAQLIQPSDNFRNSLVSSKKPLQLYFNQQSIDKYVYLDMMKFKVKHILFVATLYDAFTLENEDSFFERFMGEIYQYSLFSVPRITGVTSAEEALDLIETTNFDLVILMAGMDREKPISISEQIRAKKESLPIYLLLNKKSDIKYFEELVPSIKSVDNLFVWNGDSLILFAIVKSTEDRVNVENDTNIGLVRVILLIEDSPLYYSKYLQFLYDIVFGQVQQLLPEVEKNEIDKISKMRSRPKILLARNYEEAISIFNKYRDFLLCVISDVEFDRGGKMDKNAGVNFIKHVKANVSNVPIILQSSEDRNRLVAEKLGVTFINKNSETLLKDLKLFLISYLGFGYFVFRDKEGNKLGVAKSLREFETLLREVSDESLYLHASENKFSLWLMSRGEIQLAKTLNPVSASMFSSADEMRQFFLDTIKHYREEKKKGKILSFSETSSLDEKNIVSFAGGSLGGKGRGLAFINTLIYNLDFSSLANRINILAPITVVIGSNEFQQFISRNKLYEKIVDTKLPYAELRRHFAESRLSISLLKKLKVFVDQIHKPIAVRSSSSSEDSITQPFAGVFDTYFIPNHVTNKKQVLRQLSTAIKLVYASTFSEKARNYFALTHHKVEEEKMAVVLQELVGNRYGDYYYPHISGVAQSYNFYPVANMKPEEGFAVAAVGIGSYVVDGWKSYRFSPKYPKVSIHSIKDLMNNSQVQFYALNCREREFDFLEHGELAAFELLDISVAEKHGTLTHCVSVYNANNDRLEPGLSSYGPRVINFANILQYNYIPLAETLNLLLNNVKEAFGSPVEIEYAVDLNRKENGLPTFYLLQIKPLIGNQIMQDVVIDQLDHSKMILYSKSSLGNGEVKEISDVIFVDPKRFDKMKTIEMAAEIEALNNAMCKSRRQYVLIGPGRWGSRDRFVGIPVNWAQISNAKVIVEVSLDGYPLDSSLGSHFFHNVTSMNIGYFSVLHSSSTDFVKWEMLNQQEVIQETEFFRHVRFEKPFTILMDGRHKTSAIIT